jgi:hypothetical protein
MLVVNPCAKEDWRSSDVGIADWSSHESGTVETCRFKKRAIRFTVAEG